MNDHEVIDAFVTHLQDHGYPDLRVDRRPDKENRGTPDIDAIAGNFAIEHTSVDTLPNQRRNSDWFMRAAGKVELEIDVSPSFRLSIILEYDAVAVGQDWTAVRSALKRWLVNEAPRLSDGQFVLENLPGIPFRLHVVKSSQRSPGVFFARFQPNDDTLPLRIKVTFDRKAEKLLKYQNIGLTTILLVESNDIALMSDEKMLEAIKTGFFSGPPPGVDQVWYANTSIESSLEFCDFTQQLKLRTSQRGQV